jgi:TPR repeat protein
MKQVLGQTAALHVAFWQYDPWYRRVWYVWPQAAAILLAGWVMVDRGAIPVGPWAKPADCSNTSTPGCAATRRAAYYWDDEIGRATIANQTTVSVDRSAFLRSAAADQPKLAAALGVYYRNDWAKAVDLLKSANQSDPNVQFVTALASLIPNSTDQARTAQVLLRSAAAAGHRQAGGILGRILMIGSGGIPRDEVAGRKLIEDGAAAGDTYAMRLAAAGYVSGGFAGGRDPAKVVELLRRAADAGDPVAMAQLAYCIHTGRGGLPHDDAKALDYLRRSAEAGFAGAQFTLGRLFRDRYGNREIEDMSESVKWYERAFKQGYTLGAISELAWAHRFARAAPWSDTKRSFELLQLCAPYKSGFCHYWAGRAYNDGAGVARDYVKAYAHYTVSKELGYQDSAALITRLESSLQPAAKTSATELAKTMSANLKPIPRTIWLESPETDAGGPSPWALPSAPSAAGPSSSQ